MAKVKISEFSTTAGNNTDINSINIAEGCAPSGINDAIRELMRQLKEFQTGGAGDSVNSGGDFSVATNKFTVASASGNTSVAGTLGVTGAATLSSTLAVTGTTTLTGALVANGNATLGDASGDTVTIKGTPTLEVNPTLSGGTANGVLYLNGSKVATSGSALTFDGTNLTTNAIKAGSNSGDVLFGRYDATYPTSGIGFFKLGTNNYNADTGGFNLYTNNSGALRLSYQAVESGSGGSYHLWNASGSEAMRLTSTGLGVGTSSPGARLTTRAAANSYTAGALQIESLSGTYKSYITNVGGLLLFSNSSTVDQLILDSSGNLGLGVTPSAWSLSGLAAFQVKSASMAGYLDNNYLSANAYFNGSNWARISANYATQYFQDGATGKHIWNIAGTSTADSTISFTQAMTLDASGRLLVGLTSGTSGYNIEAQAGASGTGIRASNSGGGYIAIEAESNATSNGVLRWTNDLKFIEGSTQRMQLSSGNLLVGTTSNTEGARLFVSYPYGTSGGAAPIGTEVDSTLSIRAVSFRNPNGLVGTISTSGSSTAYNTSSDYRLKDNPQPLTGSGAFIDALKPKTWNWKADGSKGVGFIAHEVQEVSPGSVVGEKDGEQMQAMEYGSAEFIANIIAELQSLRARVAALES